MRNKLALICLKVADVYEHSAQRRLTRDVKMMDVIDTFRAQTQWMNAAQKRYDRRAAKADEWRRRGARVLGLL